MTSSHIPTRLSRQVRQRAGDCCEYCRLPQSCQEATFHIDHVTPRDADGETVVENLALACVTCSLKKAAKTHVTDSRTGRKVAIFNPRKQSWETHFEWTRSWRLRGRTATGRATVTALGMNRPAIIAIRQLLAGVDRFPPDECGRDDDAS